MNAMNLIGPTILMADMVLCAVSMVRRGVVSIWTPLFWARISLAAYYGAGSLVPYFVNEDTRAMMEAFYFSYPKDVAKFNLVGSLFALFFLIGTLIFSHILDSRHREDANSFLGWQPRASGPGSTTMALLFLIVGSIVDYGLMLPHALGLINTATPQAIALVAMASWLGCFLLTYTSIRDSSPLLYLAIAAGILSSAVGVVQFAKSTAIFPLIMLAMGAIYAKPRITVLIGSFLAITLFFFAVAPVVTYARNVLYGTYGADAPASFSERIGILSSYTAERAEEQNKSDIQGGWARLSYINSGTFAINQYDAGRPGNSLKYAIIVFIPRILYPDKPIITDSARDFNASINNNDASASSPGLAPELYWNGGWIAVVIGATFVGFLLAIISGYSTAVLNNDAFHLLFVVLLGIRMGIRMDGFLVPDILGPAAVMVIGHVILTVLNNLSLKK